MKRDRYVDIVKGICIICVVYVHINIVMNQSLEFKKYIDIFIEQFFLTAFYIISGFYLKEINKPKNFINTKVKKWYIKLIIYYIPFVLLHNVFINIGFYDIGKEYGNKITTMYSTNTMIIKIIETILLMGREPLLGAMWFFISQIIAMLCLTILVYIINKLAKKYNKNNNKFIIIVLLMLLLFSTSLTNIFSITIPRISISISVMILIYIGYYFNQIIKLKYDNLFLLFISIIILISNTLSQERMILNKNMITNPVAFLTSSIAGIYALCFLGKKIEKNIVGRILGICGKYSFDIMAFHLISFKLAIFIINKLKIENITTLSDLEPVTANIFSGVIYFISGIIIPIIIAKIFELLKYKIINIKDCFIKLANKKKEETR